jgi:hypothetical protein
MNCSGKEGQMIDDVGEEVVEDEDEEEEDEEDEEDILGGYDAGGVGLGDLWFADDDLLLGEETAICRRFVNSGTSTILVSLEWRWRWDAVVGEMIGVGILERSEVIMPFVLIATMFF